MKMIKEIQQENYWLGWVYIISMYAYLHIYTIRIII
jgi:hypothetical protein